MRSKLFPLHDVHVFMGRKGGQWGWAAVVVGIVMGRANPPGFVMGSAGVWVRVDILLPGPNPYPSHGFHGYWSVWST